MLFAPSGVSSRRLEVTISPGTDPHVLPGRRDRQRFDTTQIFRFAKPPSVRIKIEKAFTVSLPCDTWQIVRNVTEVRRLSQLSRLSVADGAPYDCFSLAKVSRRGNVVSLPWAVASKAESTAKTPVGFPTMLSKFFCFDWEQAASSDCDLHRVQVWCPKEDGGESGRAIRR